MDLSWDYINRLQTYECGNWGTEAALFLFWKYINGIFVAMMYLGWCNVISYHSPIGVSPNEKSKLASHNKCTSMRSRVRSHDSRSRTPRKRTSKRRLVQEMGRIVKWTHHLRLLVRGHIGQGHFITSLG